MHSLHEMEQHKNSAVQCRRWLASDEPSIVRSGVHVGQELALWAYERVRPRARRSRMMYEAVTEGRRAYDVGPTLNAE